MLAADRNYCVVAELRLAAALKDKAAIHTAYRNAVKTHPAEFDGSPECLCVNACVRIRACVWRRGRNQSDTNMPKCTRKLQGL